MSFEGIKGQDRAVSFLKGSLASGRIAHAYIFFGPKGVGKMLAAVNFAKALNCQATAGGKPCGSCASCKKIDASSHPDVFTVRPLEGAASIKIDDIRALIGDVGLKPYEAKKKVYIIDETNALTDEAANALLKTLEEPPTDSVLILIVERLSMLLPTIVSRSQVVKFFALATDKVCEVLMTRGIDAKKARILAGLSSGSVGEALKYSDEKFFEARSGIIKALAGRTFFDREFDKVSRAELRAQLNIVLTWYRDIMIAKALGVSGAELVNIDERQAILDEAENIGFDALDRIVKQIISTCAYLEQNANPKLAMAALGVMI